jgi:hypothetical protein
LGRKTPGDAESFQWIETPNGDLVLMSLATNRFLRVDAPGGRIVADSAGPLPDGSDGARFVSPSAGSHATTARRERR